MFRLVLISYLQCPQRKKCSMLLEWVKAGCIEIRSIRYFMVFVWSLVMIKRKQDMHVSLANDTNNWHYIDRNWGWFQQQCGQYSTKTGIQNQTHHRSNLVSETAQDFARNNLVTWSYSLNSIGKLIDVNGAGLSPCRITCSYREKCLSNAFFQQWFVYKQTDEDLDPF